MVRIYDPDRPRTPISDWDVGDPDLLDGDATDRGPHLSPSSMSVSHEQVVMGIYLYSVVSPTRTPPLLGIK